PPVRGRLHTRYAPVRHSLPPESGIPSDLHVLGLPLAFILSQDQTLHCKLFLNGLPHFVPIRMIRRPARKRERLSFCFPTVLQRTWRRPLAPLRASAPSFHIP